MNPEWHKAFFQGGALEIWRMALSPEQTAAEVDFLTVALRVGPGARLLDAPCGNGRHMIEFAARGCTAAGVDISTELLREAAENSTAFRGSLEFRELDLREIYWSAEFDGGYCFGNCFGYFDRAGMRTYLEAVSRALKPGAHFVVDTAMAAESVLPRLETHLWWELDGLHILTDSTYHPRENLLEVEHRFFRRGSAEMETRTSRHWIYTVGEICWLLESAGFSVLDAWASTERTPFAPGAPYLILTAQKK